MRGTEAEVGKKLMLLFVWRGVVAAGEELSMPPLHVPSE